MQNRNLFIFAGVVFSLIFGGATVLGAPSTSLIYQKTIIPELDSTYDLGTSTKAWRYLYTNNICLSGDCKSAWPSGSGGFNFTPATNYGVNTSATTAPMWFQAGAFASSSTAYPTLAVQQSGAGPVATFLGGNVGIGSSSPTKKLVVTVSATNQSAIGDAGSGYSGLWLGQSGMTTTNPIIQQSGNTAYFGLDSGGAYNFGINNTNTAVLSSSNFRLAASVIAGWSSDGNAQNPTDTSISRAAAGKLYVNNSNTSNGAGTLVAGSVGVGSTTPYAKLSVKGAGTTSGVNFQTTNSSDSPLITALDSGLVGIGTSTPNTLLSINKPTSVASQSFVNLLVAGKEIMTLGEDIVGNYGGAVILKDGLGGSGNVALRYNGGYPQFTTTQQTFNFIGSGFTTRFSNAYIDFAVGGVTNMTMIGGGLTAIGTSTPYSRLTVWGTGATSATTAFQAVNNASSTILTLRNDQSVLFGTITNPSLTVDSSANMSWSAGTKTFTLPSGSTWTTGTNNNSTIFTYTGTLNTSSSATTTLFRVTPTISQSGSAGYTAMLVDATESSVGTGERYLFDARLGGVTRFNITSAGRIGIGTTSPGTPLSIGNTGGINFNPTATSTFSSSANGINITNGCYAIAGVCIGAGGGGTVTAVTGTWPIISSGGTTPNLTWGGIATSSPIAAASGLLYATGVNTFASISTSSPIAMSISGNAGTVTNGVYTTDTGTVTNTMLAGSIANAKLANSSITVSNGGGLTMSGSPVSLGGTLTVSLNTGNANTWSALQQFNGNASTTQFSVYNNAYFGATATSTFNSTGWLGIASSTPWGALSINPNALGVGVPEFVVGSSSATHFLIDGAGNVGVGTTTPWSKFAINFSSILDPLVTSIFSIGSSTKTLFEITSGGQVAPCESKPATSTAMTLDWTGTCPLVTYQMGSSAFSITIINATTTRMSGSRKMVEICNPNGTAGAVTWAGAEWFGGTVPTQTTTANQCDTWSFYVGSATSTSAYKVHGAQTAGFQ